MEPSCGKEEEVGQRGIELCETSVKIEQLEGLVFATAKPYRMAW